MMQPKRSLPQMIRTARKQKKLTQEELALLAGVSVSSIANWEAGRMIPTMDKLEGVIAALDGSLNPTAVVTALTKDRVAQARASVESAAVRRREPQGSDDESAA